MYCKSNKFNFTQNPVFKAKNNRENQNLALRSSNSDSFAQSSKIASQNVTFGFGIPKGLKRKLVSKPDFDKLIDSGLPLDEIIKKMKQSIDLSLIKEDELLRVSTKLLTERREDFYNRMYHDTKFEHHTSPDGRPYTDRGITTHIPDLESLVNNIINPVFSPSSKQTLKNALKEQNLDYFGEWIK